MLINTSSNPLMTIIHLLSSIGAINWGLIGLYNGLKKIDKKRVSRSFALSKIVYQLKAI